MESKIKYIPCSRDTELNEYKSKSKNRRTSKGKVAKAYKRLG